MAEATEKYQQAGPKVMPGVVKEEMVYTWPYLVSIEAIMSVAFLITLTILSTFVNAPLLDLANGEITPDPSKAPWYFLGLQELLLHMHPSLAGVVVPTAVLVMLGLIPYIDRDRRGTGIWFSTKRGVSITIFAMVYTAIIEIGLILFDQYFKITGMPDGAHGIEPFITWALMQIPGLTLDKVDWVGKIFVPTIMMIAIPWILVLWLQKRYKNMNTREIMIGLYGFFLASFIVLSITGTAFRGHSMNLMWPWMIGGH